MLKKIQDCQINFPTSVGEKCKEMIRKLVVPNPLKRAKIEEIKQHVFYRQGQKAVYNFFQDENMRESNFYRDVTVSIISTMNIMGYKKDVIESQIKQSKKNKVTACFELLYNKLSRGMQSGQKNATEANSDMLVDEF